MQIIMMTSDHYHHCLLPFMHLWEKYFINQGGKAKDLDMVICGFTKPDVDLKKYGWRFHSIGSYEDYPANRWSDAFIKVLDEVAAEQFMLTLEDFWLVRPVDTKAIKMLFDYAAQFENVLKVDVTAERLWINGGATFFQGTNTYNYCGYLDLIKSPPGTAYQMSLWCGIWNREVMKHFIVPGEKAQEIETIGTERVNWYGDSILVLGTRQAPMLHANIYQSRHEGKPVYADSGWAVPLVDLEYMKQQGWIG